MPTASDQLTPQTSDRLTWDVPRRRIFFLLSSFVLVALVLIALIGYRECWQALRSASPLPIVCALLIMAAGWLAWALLYKVLLDSFARKVSLRSLLYLVLVGLAAVRLLPSAGASGAAARFYFWRRAGVSTSEVLTVLVASEVAFYFGLVLLLWVGLVDLWMTAHLTHRLVTSVAVISVVVTLLIIAIAIFITSDLDQTRFFRSFIRSFEFLLTKSPLRNRFVPSLAKWRELMKEIRTDIRRLMKRPIYLLVAGFCALLWWLANLLSLVAVFAGFHAEATWGALLVAMVFGALAGSLAGMVAGLGVHEATMLGTLSMVGLEFQKAAIAVMVFRFIEFWLPIPLGVVCTNLLLGTLSSPQDAEGSGSFTPSTAFDTEAAPKYNDPPATGER